MAESAAGTPIRVLSVPAAHPYVAHLGAPGDNRVRRLPDVIDPVSGQWWPPAPLRGSWIRDHAGEFDVAHVHFGVESFTLAELEDTTAALAATGVPLVVTVHDLENPHLPDDALSRAAHHRQWGLLVAAAHTVITLTPGAAQEIRRLWGRQAHVLPHPHLVPTARMRTATRRPRRTPVLGMHLKDLRAHVLARPLIDALATHVAPWGEVRVRVDLHTAQVRTEIAAALQEHAKSGTIEVRVHDRFADNELWDYLDDLDVCLLPYGWGSHSGWLEACWDLETPVVVPDCGYYAEQHGDPSYRTGAAVPAEVLGVSLRDAIRRALEPAAPLDRVSVRIAQRRELGDAHHRIYQAALARAAA